MPRAERDTESSLAFAHFIWFRRTFFYLEASRYYCDPGGASFAATGS